jgi:hypothetical protein
MQKPSTTQAIRQMTDSSRFDMGYIMGFSSINKISCKAAFVTGLLQ